jgi:hypothetical protein
MVAPAQLPADVSGFAGRVEQLARLDARLATAGTEAPTAVVISAVSGTAGVGKPNPGNSHTCYVVIRPVLAKEIPWGSIGATPVGW